jgi:adenosyl cobinamide kinase/adenosyl cobinamide phosphate guanylyltransferase
MVNKWHRPDILIANGDLIEGTQSKQGGAELITPDRNVQSVMAVDCLREWRAKKIFMTYGTKYHVGEQAEDFEYTIANMLEATIEGRLFLNVEGMTLDVRHKIGTSGIPHGRATALLRDLAWDLIREAVGTGPRVDIVIRSHAHYHIWVEQPGKIAFITPALQLARGRYGSRECIGETHWGAIRLTLHKGQIVGKDVCICSLHASRQPVIRIK